MLGLAFKSGQYLIVQPTNAHCRHDVTYEFNLNAHMVALQMEKQNSDRGVCRTHRPHIFFCALANSTWGSVLDACPSIPYLLNALTMQPHPTVLQSGFLKPSPAVHESRLQLKKPSCCQHNSTRSTPSIRLPPHPIPRRLVLADPDLLMGVLAHGSCTTDCGGGTPDHLGVMAAFFTGYAAVVGVVVIGLL